jgi:hypothetical protein
MEYLLNRRSETLDILDEFQRRLEELLQLEPTPITIDDIEHTSIHILYIEVAIRDYDRRILKLEDDLGG